jgi:hypothetical protein
MLGWDVRVYRKGDPERTELVNWDTGAFGTGWLDDLVNAGKATYLGGDGYPISWEVEAGVLLGLLAGGLPATASPPVIGEDYVLPANYRGKVKILVKPEEIAANEVLIVEAWDLS